MLRDYAVARTIGLCVVVVGVTCSRPTMRTDLTPEGPPVIVTVLVPSEGYGGLLATFCAEGDLKRPPDCDGSAVDPVTDVAPLGWEIRIVFDELLDPSIEEIEEDGTVHIAAAHPVDLECDGMEVEYDGFYDPSGSHLTYPPGPALVIVPTTMPAATTGGSCMLTVTDAVKDKDGNQVPMAGPFEFQIAPLAVLENTPADEAEGVDPSTNVTVTFNSHVDALSLVGHVSIRDDDDMPVPALVDADAATVTVDPNSALAPATHYTVLITAGVTDLTGGALAEDFQFSFTTGEPTPDATPADASGIDGGGADAGAPDAGPADAGSPDAGSPDAGPADASPADASPPDAGTPDAA